MGRDRKALDFKKEGRSFVVRFRHPISNRIVRFSLGCEYDVAVGLLRHLNAVFLDEVQWRNLPDNFPSALRELWEDGCGGVKYSLGKVIVDQKPIEVSVTEYVKMHAVIKALEQEVAEFRKKYTELKKKYERERGAKLYEGPSRTLQKAAEDWKQNYAAKHPGQWGAIVGYDIDRFVERFGPQTLVENVEGLESEIDTWLKSLTVGVRDKSRLIGAGRRAQIRRHVLRFLEDAGAMMQRKKSRR